MDLFLIILQLFTSQDINWWTGVMQIIVMFLSAVWLSFWRHPLTLEDLLVSKCCNDKYIQICSDGETNSAIS